MLFKLVFPAVGWGQMVDYRWKQFLIAPPFGPTNPGGGAKRIVNQ